MAKFYFDVLVKDLYYRKVVHTIANNRLKDFIDGPIFLFSITLHFQCKTMKWFNVNSSK